MTKYKMLRVKEETHMMILDLLKRIEDEKGKQITVDQILAELIRNIR